MEFTPGWLNIWKLSNVIHHINRLKKKNHMIISTNAEKNIWQNPTPIHNKTLSILGIEESFLNLIKKMCKKKKKKAHS